jgi:GNAT superfamily N-acetyltransferase
MGFGAMLLDHVINIGKKEGLETIRLDSGHHRHDAHRLYLNKGFHIHSQNFSMSLIK